MFFRKKTLKNLLNATCIDGPAAVSLAISVSQQPPFPLLFFHFFSSSSNRKMPRIKSKFMNLTSSTTFTTTSLLCATVLLMIMSTALADVNLSRRDEAYQPAISHDFPHLLGSKRVLGWMDSSVDPCNDFFQYSCGKKYAFLLCIVTSSLFTIFISIYLPAYPPASLPPSLPPCIY